MYLAGRPLENVDRICDFWPFIRIYVAARIAAMRDWTVLRTNGERKISRSGPYGVVEIFSCSIAHNLDCVSE
jgi:hypothetical protein